MATEKKVIAEDVKEETKVEAFNPDETLFEDGPTLGEVEEWKSLFGQVYLTEFEDGEVFIFRTLNRKEFKDIMKLEAADSLYREERVSEKCVVWPKEYNFLSMSAGKAGVPSLISEQVMEKSGFSAITNAIML